MGRMEESGVGVGVEEWGRGLDSQKQGRGRQCLCGPGDCVESKLAHFEHAGRMKCFTGQNKK